MHDFPEEESSPVPLRTKVILCLQLASIVWVAYQGYSLYKASKILQNTVPRSSASIQILSKPDCENWLEIREFKDGKLVNKALTCKDSDIHHD